MKLAFRLILLAASLTILNASVSYAQNTTNWFNSTTNPVPGNAKWIERHDGFVRQAKAGDIDLLFLGDSITDWFCTHGSNVWNQYYAPLHAANFGIAGDKVEQVLWRVKNGELDGIKPKVLVLLIGTNNKRVNTTPQIVDGITLLVKDIRMRLPKTKILLLGIFPSGEKADPVRDKEQNINARIAKLAHGRHVKYLDLWDKFLEPDGTLSHDIMPDLLHPSEKGYRIWAEAIAPTLNEMMK